MMTTDPHAREAAAAVAGMAQTYGYVPQRGDIVEVETPFTGERATGVVLEVVKQRCVVSLNGETLIYRTDELEPVQTAQESRRSR